MARWKEAEVAERKVLDYLLSSDHPVGGDKAAFFRAMGYSKASWTRLRDDLLHVGRHGEIVSEHESRFGIKYVIDGIVRAPTGRAVGLRTVWISDGRQEPLRLVTAYPGGRRLP